MDVRETADRWAGRNAIVGSLITRGSVLDLGSGAEGLRAFLPPGCEYTGIDRPEFDMNRGRWPEGRWDTVVLSGVLEYARYPAAVLRHLRDLAPIAIVTYSHGGRRRDPAWVNNLSRTDLEQLAAKVGYRAEAVSVWRHPGLRAQVVWRLRSA